MKLKTEHKKRAIALQVAAVVGAMGLPMTVLAQDSGQTGQEQSAGNKKLDRVEVSARPMSDTEQRRRSSVAKQIYGREEIDKFGDDNVNDVLKRLPGVTLSSSGSPALRGMGSYTQILLNGEPPPPGFSLDRLSPSQIDRIEITKAPTADKSAQAVAGTINIILRDPPRIRQRDLQLRVGYNTDYPVGGLNFTWTDRAPGGAALTLPVSLFQWRGASDQQTLSFLPGQDGLPSLYQRTSVNDFWGQGFNVSPRLSLRMSENETLNIQTFAMSNWWNNSNTKTTESTIFGNPTVTDDSRSNGRFATANINAKYTNQINDDTKIELRAAIGKSNSRYRTQTVSGGLANGVERRLLVGDADNLTYSTGGKYSRTIGEQHTLTAGWDLEWRERDETRRTTFNGIPLLSALEANAFSSKVQRSALFVQDEWDMSERLAMYFGIRGERITSESSVSGTNVSARTQVVTPMWHMTYKLDPKARDLIRASITRSFKAPTVDDLLGRITVSDQYSDITRPNIALSPDRSGNPSLKPELATGFDVNYEHYLVGGGMASVGVFYRKVNNLMRTQTSLENVPWASVPRWVARPQNVGAATTTGLELELRGKAGELLPGLVDMKVPLNLRGAVNIYRSKVSFLPGPDNRLESPPWTSSFGVDYRLTGVFPMPVNMGANMSYTPSYRIVRTAQEASEIGRTRAMDVFASFPLSPTMSLRVGAQNLAPVANLSKVLRSDGYYVQTRNEGRTWYGFMLNMKL